MKVFITDRIVKSIVAALLASGVVVVGVIGVIVRKVCVECIQRAVITATSATIMGWFCRNVGMICTMCWTWSG